VVPFIALNLTRRPARTLLTAGGIAVGVATIVALLSVTAGLNRSAGSLIHLGRADLGLFQSNSSDPTTSVLPGSLVRRVASDPLVKHATPLLLVTDSIPHQSAAIAFGAEPDGFVVRRLVFVAGGGARGDEALIGDQLARTLHTGVGGELTVRDRRLRVTGVYHSGVSFEDSGAILPLQTAQRIAGREGEVTTIAVQLAAGVGESKGRTQLQKHFPGLTAITDVEEAVSASASSALISKAIVVIVVLALIIGGIAVANTMAIVIIERERELALLATVGWTPLRVAGLVLGEGVAVSLIGAAIGLLLGVVGSSLLVGALSASSFVAPEITAWGLGRGLLVGVAIGVFGGLYPAWRVTRLLPARSLARV
jgi:putative ABC transport system permease protein